MNYLRERTYFLGRGIHVQQFHSAVMELEVGQVVVVVVVVVGVGVWVRVVV